MRSKGVGRIIREIVEDHQTKARLFTIPKLHHVPRKLYRGRLVQLRRDFITDYSLILNLVLPSSRNSNDHKPAPIFRGNFWAESADNVQVKNAHGGRWAVGRFERENTFALKESMSPTTCRLSSTRSHASCPSNVSTTAYCAEPSMIHGEKDPGGELSSSMRGMYSTYELLDFEADTVPDQNRYHCAMSRSK